MSTLYGTLIADKIVPTDSLDSFPTHDEEYGLGGWRTVPTLAQRDAIYTPRRKEGMIVFVLETLSAYQLLGGIDNINWQSFGGANNIKRFTFVNKEEIIIEGVTNYPIVTVYVTEPIFKPVLFGEYTFGESLFRQDYEISESTINGIDLVYTKASNTLKVILPSIYSGIIVVNE